MTRMWTEVALWAGIAVLTWLESKPQLVDAIESVSTWISGRSGWWILVAYVLWGLAGSRLVALVGAINPPWPIMILALFLYSMGTLAILAWGLMKLLTWALRPRRRTRHTNLHKARNTTPIPIQQNAPSRGYLYKNVRARRTQYLAMHRERRSSKTS